MSHNEQNNSYPQNLLNEVVGNDTMPEITASYFDSEFQSVLSELPEQNKTAILRRYRDQMTLRAVGETLCVSTERARQLVHKGLLLLNNSKLRGRLLGLNVEETRGTNLSLDNLDISVRAYNCLSRWGLKTTDEIFDLSAAELRKERGA